MLKMLFTGLMVIFTITLNVTDTLIIRGHENAVKIISDDKLKGLSVVKSFQKSFIEFFDDLITDENKLDIWKEVFLKKHFLAKAPHIGP